MFSFDLQLDFSFFDRFGTAKVFNCNGISFINFFSHIIYFVFDKTTLPSPRSLQLSSMFSSRSGDSFSSSILVCDPLQVKFCIWFEVITEVHF